mgnify:CR=1 FL=1
MRRWSILILSVCLCALINQSVRAQNIPVPLTEVRLYDFLDELATDGVVSINTAVRPYSRVQVAAILMEAQTRDTLLSRRQCKDLAFYLNEFALERDTMREQFVQYTDHRTFNLSLCNPQFSYMTSNHLFKMQIRPILGMDVIASKKGGILKRWWGAELQMDIVRHLSIWGSLRDISWNGEMMLREQYFPDTYAKIDGAKLTKGAFLNNFAGVQYKEANYGGDFSDSKGGISAYAWFGSISLQRENIRWGDAFHCSNILSGRNPAVPMVTLQLTPCKWFQFDYFHAWLVSNVIDSTYYYVEQSTAGTEREYRPTNKYMAANMFTFRPIKYIQFSLGNSIVYSERNPQAAYFIPIAFYKSLDHLMTKGLGVENQNSQAFFTLTVRPVDHLKLYGSFFIDEFQLGRLKKSNKENNPISYLVGFDWGGWPIKSLSLKGEFMRSYIACYTHSIPAITYMSNSYMMGHYMGDNAQNIHLEISYRPIRGMFIGLSYNRDTKYNSYDYLRVHRENGKKIDVGAGISAVIARKPFDKKIYNNDEILLNFVYEVHPNMFLRANVGYNNAQGYDNTASDCNAEFMATAQGYLNSYCPKFYQGKNVTATIGFSFGF